MNQTQTGREQDRGQNQRKQGNQPGDCGCETSQPNQEGDNRQIRQRQAQPQQHQQQFPGQSNRGEQRNPEGQRNPQGGSPRTQQDPRNPEQAYDEDETVDERETAGAV
jgi:hypothetical protein